MKASHKYCFGTAALAILATISSAANAQSMIQGPAQITNVTSTIPDIGSPFALSQIADGITADSNGSGSTPWNGFVGKTNTTGSINFTLDKDYDVTSSHLWNDINVLAESISSYSLKFYDAGGAPISTRGPFSVVPGQPNVQVQTFAAVPGVRRVEFVVHSLFALPNTAIRRVEIREIAFDGEPTPLTVDVPGDHYQCYRAEGPTLKPETITVADQFGKAQLVLGRPELVCNPSIKRHGKKTYQVEYQKRHLICYSLVEQTDRPRSRKVKTANQFTSANLLTNERRLFCVPSLKTLIGEKEILVDKLD